MLGRCLQILFSEHCINIRKRLAAVEFLCDLAGDDLQRGQKYDQIPSDALPDAEHHRHRQTAPAAVEPANVGRRQVQYVREHIVEHPLGVENVPEDERDDDPRGNDRDVIDHAERDAEARDGIDEHCGK